MRNNEVRQMDSLQHSVYECYYHIIFCTYCRKELLTTWEVEEILKENIKRSVEILHGQVEMIELDPCHVHILCKLPPSASLSMALQRIKGSTSRYIRKAFPGLGGKRLWSKSYYTATVGSRYDALKKYFAHHTFK